MGFVLVIYLKTVCMLLRQNLILVGLILGVSTVCDGQDYIPLTIKPNIGVNFTELILEESMDGQSLARMGYNAGIDVRYGTKVIGRSGIHYYRLGSAIQADIAPEPDKVTASQLKIPLGIGYKIYKVDYFNLWVHTDMVLNYTMGIKEGLNRKPRSQYPRTGFSGRVGFGIDLSRFSLEFNYERGFTEFLSETAEHHLASLAIGMKL